MRNLFIKVYIKSDKERDGLSPLYCGISYKQTKTTFSLGQLVNTNSWKNKDQFRKTRDPNEREIRSNIDQLVLRIENTAETWETEGKKFNVEMLKNSIDKTGDLTRESTISDCFAAHKDGFDLKIAQKTLKPSSYKKYRSVEAHLETFVKKEYTQSSFIADNLDDKFFAKFNKYLYTKLKHNQVVKYCILFRRVLKEAVQEGIIKQFPFKVEYKATLDTVEKDKLTEMEVQAIEKKEFTNERLNRVKDCFLFCCYTGLAYADVKALSENHIKTYDGTKVIEKEREKTGGLSIIPLCEPALAILDKYEWDEGCIVTGKLLPVISNTKYNLYLKDIMICCEINKNLVTHLARHTFATISLNRGVDIVTVKEAMGHSRIQQTLQYAKLDTKTSIREFKKLEGVFGSKPEDNPKPALKVA